MAHVLILGMTESGKTTKARKLASCYRRQGYGVLVLDPLCDPRWDCDFITADQEDFLDVFWRSRSCMAFLDEGGESVGRYDLAMQETATRGRHWGHSCHYIAQKATQLAPIVRDQCSYVYLFTSGLSSCKMLAEEFNKPELLNGTKLKMYSYFLSTRFGQCKLVGGLSNDSDLDSGRGGSDDARSVSKPTEEGRNDNEDTSGDQAGDGGGSRGEDGDSTS